jgi:hypothetical protein
MPRGVIPDLTAGPDGPDLSGFAEAQDRLRVALGVDAVFLIPQASVWPVGTEINPDTDEPYDPTVVPTSGGGVNEVVVRVAPVQRPIGGGDDVIEGPSGVRQDETIALRINPADKPAIDGARSVIVHSIEYRVTEVVDDDDQWIVFGEAT